MPGEPDPLLGRGADGWEASEAFTSIDPRTERPFRTLQRQAIQRQARRTTGTSRWSVRARACATFLTKSGRRGASPVRVSEAGLARSEPDQLVNELGKSVSVSVRLYSRQALLKTMTSPFLSE